jgi:hypothetical protein
LSNVDEAVQCDVQVTFGLCAGYLRAMRRLRVRKLCVHVVWCRLAMCMCACKCLPCT